MIELHPDQFEPAGALFAGLEEHLAIASILAGLTPGRVWVDREHSPGWGMAWFHSRLYLAGDVSAPGAVAEVQGLLADVISPAARQEGMDALVLQPAPGIQAGDLSAVLEGLNTFPAQRQCYVAHTLAQDWRPLLPEGFELRPVTAELVEHRELDSVDELRMELCSERPSLADFFEKSFGVCLLESDKLAAWCLSEYNLGGRCEVGVATVEAYQRRGLGTVVSLALVEEALRRGCHTIGWHCWKRNVPSAALARRAGFELHSEAASYVILLEEEKPQ